MENFIKHLEIKNFKSIKHLSLDCKRVNVFIGKPNVGKSNILEAMGLFSMARLDTLSRVVRFESFRDLFLDNDLLNTIEIHLNKVLGLEVSFETTAKGHFRGIAYNKDFPTNLPLFDLTITRDGKIAWGDDNSINFSFPRYYQYEVNINDSWQVANYLVPPNGENLFEIVNRYPEIRIRIVEMLKEQNLNFTSLIEERKFKLQKNLDGFIIQYPYSSIADTFQRFIFYLAAIESNSDSVLIFEEPEVHSFPPYVKELAERMVLKDDNQYFVSTHSPYLLQTFIDSLDDSQLNVYLTYYKDYQTHVKALSSEELRDIQDFGYDVFFNLRKFEPNA